MKKHIYLLAFFLLCQFAVYSQGVASVAEGIVDPFTGDVRYSLPLITLPGANGESYPVGLTYSSGVQVDQAASWVGTGWDFNPGEIKRIVHGVPDDFNGEVILDVKYDVNGSVKSNDAIIKYGPLYYTSYYSNTTNSNANIDMDVNISLGPYSYPYYYPAFDQYFLNMPGKQSEISLNIFDQGMPTLMVKGISDLSTAQAIGNGFYRPVTQKPQFRIKGALASDVSLPGPVWSWSTEPGVPYQPAQCNPNTASTGGTTITTAPQNIGVVNNYNYYTGLCYDQTNKRIVEGNFVQYFTNDEINYYDPSNSSNSLMQSGFLDYKAYDPNVSSLRPTPTFPKYGIGAILITDANGITYHFSLPVYNNSSSTNTYYLTSTGNKLAESYSNSNRYAISWKLTSITGPDYIDVNQNGIPDQGDEGYWIYFDWVKWADHFQTTFPTCDLNYNASQENLSKGLSNTQKMAVSTYQQYAEVGTQDKNDYEQYYINAAKTSTHTLVFLKDLTYDNSSTVSSTGSATPSLCLKKVLLFNNRDNPYSLFNNTANFSTISSPSGITLSTTNNGHFSYNDYIQNQTQIDPSVLKAAQLNFDYSLSKQYTGNLNTVSAYSILQNTSNLFIAPYPSTQNSSSLGNNYSNSGKLTLNSVQFYELKNSKIFNPFLFSYQSNSGDKNPDYPFSRLAIDNWGYYKSDYSPLLSNGSQSQFTNYRTDVSAPNIDVWSLQSITNPSGEVFNIHYESDIIANPQPMILVNDIVNHNGDHNPTYDAYTNSKFETIGNYTITDNGISTHPLTSKNDYLTNITGAGVNAYGSGTLAVGNYWGINVSVLNFSKLYGGGTRVSSIDVTDINQSETYTLKYDYSNGNAQNSPSYLSLNSITRYIPYAGSNGTNQGAAINIGTLSYLNTSTANVPTYTVGYEVVQITQQGRLLANKNYGKKIYQFGNPSACASLSEYDSQKLGRLDYNVCYPLTYCLPNDFVSDFYQLLYNDDYSLQNGTLLKEELYDNRDNLICSKVNNYQLYSTIQSGYSMISKTTLPAPLVISGNWSVTQMVNTYEFGPYMAVPTLITTGACQWGDHPEQFVNALGEDITPHMNSFIACVGRLFQYALTSVQEYKDGTTSLVSFSEPEPILGVYTQQSTTNDGKTISHVTDYNNAYGNLSTPMGSKLYNPTNKNIINAVSTVRSESRLLKQNVWANSILMRSFDVGTSSFTNTTKQGLWHVDQMKVGAFTSGDRKLVYSPTLVNDKNKIIEKLGNGNRFSSVKYGYNRIWPIVEIDQGRYGEYTHTSAEDELVNGYFISSEVGIGNGSQVTASSIGISAHTGSYVIAVPAAGVGFTYTTSFTDLTPVFASPNNIFKNKDYISSVWVYSSTGIGASILPTLSASISGTTIASTSSIYQKCGNWTLLRLRFNIPTNTTNGNIVISVNNPSGNIVYLDDFRFQPAGSEVTSQVYDLFSGFKTYSINSDNFYTRFEYDNAGRLINTYVETTNGEKKINSTQYHQSTP